MFGCGIARASVGFVTRFFGRFARMEVVMHALMDAHRELVQTHGGKCLKCGFDDSEQLQFVHRRGWQKFTLSGMNLMRPTYQLQQEIRKCDLLCSKCKKG